MSNKSGMGIAILAGMAIGVGIGILAAPDKGSKTRQKIKGGFDDATTGVKEKFGSLTGKLKNKAAEMDIEGTFDNLVSTLTTKSEDVVSFFESKLESLRQDASKYKRNSGQ